MVRLEVAEVSTRVALHIEFRARYLEISKMEISFLALAFCYLAGLTKEIALHMVADAAVSALHQSFTSRDVASLMEECLGDAVKNKSPLLNGSRKPVPGGSLRETYLDAVRLHQYLTENPSIKADVSLPTTTNPWREYLKPFQEIIVIPGFSLSEADYLDLIQVVLDEAQKLFEQRVAHRHPAFEQVLLEYQRKHSDDHQQILKEITTLSETVKETGRSQEVRTSPLQLPSISDGWLNPFSVVAADDLELANPEHVRQIGNLFIARYTDLPTFKKRYNTILEGQRGTGKTMIMKYLAFETQIREWRETKGLEEKDFLSGPESFIGVYSKLGQGVYDKADFEAIDDQSRRERIFEHRLSLQLLYDVLETMKSVYEHFPPNADQFLRVKKNLNLLLKVNGELDGCKNHRDMIVAAQDHINFTLIQQVDEYLGSVSPGGSSQETGFNPSLTLTGQLLPLLNLLRQSCVTAAPFFLMLDDFDVLEAYQQARVFKTASKREFSTACFKFGVMVLGRKSMLSGESRTFRSSDDYDRIDLDWTRGGLHDKYQTALVEIGNARLEAADSGWPAALSALLPDWQRGTEIFSAVKALMEVEWEALEEKPTESKSDYVSKYGSARFFQTLRNKKIRMRYAGIENVTLVSSGIYRQFLEACKLIFDRAHDRNWRPKDRGVPPEIQDDAIREYSEEMIQQFSRTSGDSQALLCGDIEVTSSHMITLIDSLCDVFYSRLHTPVGTLGEGEPEIICVAIRDELKQCPEAEILLNIGVRESILHRFTYKPKTAGGPPLPAFMLNRRLGPRRDLSIRRMQGRIEVEARDIILAANDRRKFFDKIQGKKVNADKTNDGDEGPPSQMDLPSE